MNFTDWYALGVTCLAGIANTKTPAEPYKVLPERSEWELLSLDLELSEGSSSIILPLDRSNGLCCIDVDKDEQGIIASLLPPTPLKRHSVRGYANIYRVGASSVCSSRSTISMPSLGIHVDIKLPPTSKDVAPPLIHLPPSIHPEGTPYTWDAEVSLTSLLDIPSLDLDALILRIEEATKGSLRHLYQARVSAGKRPKPSLEQLTEMVDLLPTDLPYEKWLRVGLIIKDNAPDLDVGRKLFENYSKKASPSLQTNDRTIIKSMFEVKDAPTVPQVVVGTGTMVKIINDSHPPEPVVEVPVDLEEPQPALTDSDGVVLFVNVDYQEIGDAVIELNNLVLYNHTVYRHSGSFWSPIVDKSAFLLLVKQGVVALNHHKVLNSRTQAWRYKANLSDHDIKEVASYIRGRLEVDASKWRIEEGCFITPRDVPDNRTDIVVFRNGIVDFNTPERKLVPFSNKFFNTATLPFDYDPDATCPWFDSIVPEYFEVGHQDPHVELLMQLYAYIIFPSLHSKKLFCIFGESGSGKSWLLNTFQWFVGPGYSIASSKDDLRTNFSTAGWDRARLITFDDYNFSSLRGNEVETFKGASSGTYMQIREKRVTSYSAVCKATIVFTTNEYPTSIRDTGGGLASRFLFIGCVKIPPHRRIPELVFKENFTKELPGIFNRIIREGYSSLKANVYAMQQPLGISALYAQLFTHSSVSIFQEWVNSGGLTPGTSQDVTDLSTIKNALIDWIIYAYPQQSIALVKEVTNTWVYSKLLETMLTDTAKWEVPLRYSEIAGTNRDIQSIHGSPNGSAVKRKLNANRVGLVVHKISESVIDITDSLMADSGG